MVSMNRPLDCPLMLCAHLTLPANHRGSTFLPGIRSGPKSYTPSWSFSGPLGKKGGNRRCSVLDSEQVEDWGKADRTSETSC